ncbi:hypothetical protein IT407_00600 [Candidatus Uhrbacteria bacterium]|nr:hypothetical protein [Candidatus Uhrbacteria bacterium]
MTKEEYMRLTAYTSIEQARHDLNILRSMFVVVLIAIFASDYLYVLLYQINRDFAVFLLIGYVCLLGLFVWKCHELKQKTKQVNKASLVFSIILAPISWIWFYPQMTEPLEIIVGNRQPPTSVQSMAERDALRKKGNRDTIRTIALVFVLTLAALSVIFFFQLRNQM